MKQRFEFLAETAKLGFFPPSRNAYIYMYISEWLGDLVSVQVLILFIPEGFSLPFFVTDENVWYRYIVFDGSCKLLKQTNLYIGKENNTLFHAT